MDLRLVLVGTLVVALVLFSSLSGHFPRTVMLAFECLVCLEECPARRYIVSCHW